MEDFGTRVRCVPSFPERRGIHFKQPAIGNDLFDIPHDAVPYARESTGVVKWCMWDVETAEVKVSDDGWCDACEEGVLRVEVGVEVGC